MSWRSPALVAMSLAMLPRAMAHIALWHPSMYGWIDNYIIQSDPDLPLQGLNFTDWWFHGWIDMPPDDGVYMELPAGGTFHGEVNCAKSFTTYGEGVYNLSYYACPDDAGVVPGQMHTSDEFGLGGPYDVRGCGLGIAYKSNVSDITPEDFTVISTNFTCPWTREVDFQIPADLPPCPEGGCHCMWGWIHAPWAGSEQMYFLGYRCNVTNAGGTVPLPAPQIARKCPIDKSNCTVGSKQPHYWYQNEGNNNFQDPYDPPYYNGDYGFANGAQTDLFDAVSTTVVYTQTSLVPVELYYTNPPPTWSGTLLFTPSVTQSSSSVTSAEISPSTSAIVTSATGPATAATSLPSTSIVSVTSTTSTPASFTATTATTPSATTTTMTTTTATTVANGSSTEKGSPTYHLPIAYVPAGGVSTSTSSSSTSSSSTSSSSIAVLSSGISQCQRPFSRRAVERLNDPNVRKRHEARAERRRRQRRAVIKERL